jgi:integrase/recombinase XerD
MTTTYAGAQALTMDQFLDVYRELDPDRDRFLALLLLCTGMRIGEALALDVEQLFNGVGDVRDTLRLRRRRTHPRTLRHALSRGRDIPINTTLRRSAVEVRPTLWTSPGALFRSRQGSRLSNRQARRILTVACRAAGLDRASSHSFRRTAAIMMDDGGVPVRVISTILGHANVAETNTYLQGVSDRQKRRATDAIAVPFTSSAFWR